MRPDNPVIVQSDRTIMLHTVRSVVSDKGVPQKDAEGRPLTEEHPRFVEARDALARAARPPVALSGTPHSNARSVGAVILRRPRK